MIKNIYIITVIAFFIMFLHNSLLAKDMDSIAERTLIEILDDISERYDVFFSYNHQMIEGVSSDFELHKNEKLNTALDRLLSSLNLSYETFGDRYIVIFSNSEASKKDLTKLKHHFEEIEKIESKGRVKVFNKKIAQLPISQAKEDQINSLVVLENIRGTVTDENGNGLIGASVVVKDTGIGTVSYTHLRAHVTLR